MKDSQPSFALKSAFLMLLGSLMLGFVITRTIYVYQKYHSELDTVDVVEPAEIGEGPHIILEDNTQIQPEAAVAQAKHQVQSYLIEEFEGDDGEINDYFAAMPEHIVIPSIDLEASIGFASLRDVKVFGDTYQQWVAPSDEVGWHYLSALLGQPGNTVLNGHHNVMGEVFKDLFLVKEGDEIQISSGEREYTYLVAKVMILPERFESREVRLQNARWIQPSEDERITLISCWPYESNTHRVVVVAFPTE